MTEADRIAARNRCHLHLAQRVFERRLPVDYRELVDIERACERLRPAFEVEGETRYVLVTRRRGIRFFVVYDTSIDALVTAYRAKAGRRPDHFYSLETEPTGA